MLGRACEKDEPDKAVQYYKQVRDLARHGFADSAGLAAASLGLEARVYLQQKKYDQATSSDGKEIAGNILLGGNGVD